MAALREHHDQGYRFALDDFTFDEQMRPFLPYCDFVKIDMRQVERGSLKSRVATMKKTKLLAEKVETREEYDFCKQAGFDYFQDYFFCKPEQAQQITDHLKLDPNSVRRAYVDSICWSEDLMTGVAA